MHLNPLKAWRRYTATAQNHAASPHLISIRAVERAHSAFCMTLSTWMMIMLILFVAAILVVSE